VSAKVLPTKEIHGSCYLDVKVCSFVYYIDVFGVVLWGVVIVILLLIGGFIKIRT